MVLFEVSTRINQSSLQICFDDSTELHHLDGRVFGKFLDVWYLIGFSQFSYTLHSPNEVGVWAGDPSLKKKFRFPAQFVFTHDIISSPRRDLSGRVSRMRQLSLAPSDAFYVILTDTMELLGLGRSTVAIRTSWQSLALHDYIYDVGIKSMVCAATFKNMFVADLDANESVGDVSHVKRRSIL